MKHEINNMKKLGKMVAEVVIKDFESKKEEIKNTKKHNEEVFSSINMNETFSCEW